MFSKIDKKIITIALILLVIIIIIGFFVYKNFNIKIPEVENSLGGESTLETQTQQGQVEVTAESTTGGGTLIVCMDECGNGTCQAEDAECATSGMNCICPETANDCPQDCKN